MALSVKLSTSLIRPFGFSGFSLGRPNCRFGPVLSQGHQQHSCQHYHAMPTASLSSRQADLALKRAHHQMLARPLSSEASNSNNSQQCHSDSVIHKTDPEAVLLAKSAPKEEENSPKDSSRPTEEQLQRIVNAMASHLPQFFKVPHDFRMYNRNIVFEDNIRNVRAVGLNQYAWQISLIKMGAHFKYGKVAMKVLKITSHAEDGTVRVRWRVETFPGNSIVLAFWKFKLWNTRDSLESRKDEWIDGFSIFQVGGDGLIHKHICDKVIPDTDKVEQKKTGNLAMKLGMALGLIPGEHFADDLLAKISEILSNL